MAAFSTYWSNLEFYHGILDYLVTSFCPTTDAVICQAKPFNKHLPMTCFQGATWVSKRGAESRTLLQPDQTFLPSHQGWLGLVICLWLQSQHATEELWDPVKNLCKCMVNSPHKINCDPKMRWCTVFLRTIKYIELSLWQWHCGFPRHTYIRPTSSRPYLLGRLKVVFQDPWSSGYHILHFHRLSCLLSETTRKTFSHGLFS